MLLYYNLKNQRKQIKLNVQIIVSRLMWRRGAWMAELHQVMGIQPSHLLHQDCVTLGNSGQLWAGVTSLVSSIFQCTSLLRGTVI